MVTLFLQCRASKDVTVTLYPRYRKQYSLQLQCRSAALQAPSATTRPLSASTGPGIHRLPPLNPFGRDQGLPLGTTNRAQPGAAALQSSALEVESAAGGLVTTACPLLAAAAFPMVQVTDALQEGVPKQASIHISQSSPDCQPCYNYHVPALRAAEL
jgi:hypothetical protein